MKLNISIKNLKTETIQIEATDLTVEYTTEELIQMYKAAPELVQLMLAAMQQQ
ncbi:MAG: hypothetical protein LBV29_02985 [Azoarcus sp.]|jgi:hypothetical protein|nr:hypothetical protein [Azoarcus sp.]